MRQLTLIHESPNLGITLQCYRNLRSLRTRLRAVMGPEYTPDLRGVCHTTDLGTFVVFTDADPDWKVYALHEVVHAGDHIMPEVKRNRRDDTAESEFRAYVVSGLYHLLLDWHSKGCPPNADYEAPPGFLAAMDRGLEYVK